MYGFSLQVRTLRYYVFTLKGSFPPANSLDQFLLFLVKPFGISKIKDLKIKITLILPMVKNSFLINNSRVEKQFNMPLKVMGNMYSMHFDKQRCLFF